MDLIHGGSGQADGGLVVTEDERATSERWARRPTSSQALLQRCRIVLVCAAGKPNAQVAVDIGVWPQTVGVWRRRFIERWLDGLVDEPRPAGPRTITDEQVEAVLVATLERAQRCHTLVADLDGRRDWLSKSTIGRIWKAFGLWPHQIDTFKLSNDPQFTYSSWLNQVERWFALLTDKQLRRGVHTSVYALEKDIRDWITNRNHDPKPFTWTKTADEILERLASYLHRIPGAGH